PEIGPVHGDGSHSMSFRIDVFQVGTVRAVALDAPVWASPAFGVEITLGLLSSASAAAPGKHDYSTAADSMPPHVVRFSALPTTPAAEFDLALIVPNDVAAARVEAVLRTAGGDTLERLELF